MAAVEARIGTVSGLIVADHLNAGPASGGRRLAHKGALVTVPRTTVTEVGGRGKWRMIEDRVDVTYLYVISPKAQRASYHEALDFEDSIDTALTDRAWMGGIRIDVTPEIRTRSVDAEWIEGTLSYTVRRRESLE